MHETDEVIARLAPSPVRRWIAVTLIGTLGAICLCLALLRPPSDLGWLILLLCIGGGALWLARRLAVATRSSIELTEAGLRAIR